MICSNTQHGSDATNRQLSISTYLSKKLKDLHIERPLNVILFYLNINSIRNNFSNLEQVIGDSVAILTTAEAKIDSTFPAAQFCLANYHTTYHLDIRDKSGGILAYIKPNIPTGQLNCGNLCKSIQVVPFEVNLRKEQLLEITIYQPPSQNSEFFLFPNKIKDHFTKFFDNYIAIGDFNFEPNDTTLKHFLDSNGLYNLLKGQSCFKGKTSLIDLILTNRNFSLNSFMMKAVII